MNKKVYLGMVNFKTKDQKFLRTFSIFTPIPFDAQEVWFLNQLYVYVLERMNECLTFTYIPNHIHCCYKILYVSLLITDYLIELTFWPFPIGF